MLKQCSARCNFVVPLPRVICQTVSEIQMVAVDVVHVTEIQQFITYADPYETVGGFWRVYYPGKGNVVGRDGAMCE